MSSKPPTAAPPPATTPPAPAARAGFFPPGTFPERTEAHVTEWYGKHLTAMHEPSLWEAARDGRTAYRFLWLRTWGHPIAVRVERTAAGVHLTATRLSGDGGYDPGKVDVQRERDLGADAWERIETALARAQYETVPVQADAGLDGSQWIVERARGGAYRLVDRWSPDPAGPHAEFRSACEVFLDLAGRDLVTGDIY